MVHKFYENSVILITGGTGFLGKVLVEKLLRTFSLKRIYLLIRTKHDRTANERLQDFFKESVSANFYCSLNKEFKKYIFPLKVFNRLRNEYPEVFKKVIPISASFDEPDLNISEELKSTIQMEVEV